MKGSSGFGRLRPAVFVLVLAGAWFSTGPMQVTRAEGTVPPWQPLRLLADLEAVRYDPRNARDDRVHLNRAVQVVQAYLGDYGFKLAADLVGVDTRAGLEEAWFGRRLGGDLRMRAGLLKVPLGVEHAQAREELLFGHYTFPAWLTGRHDLGMDLRGGGGAGSRFNWALYATAGEGHDLNGQRRAGPQALVRLGWSPWTPRAEGKARGLPGLVLFGGLAQSWDFRGRLDLSTPYRNKLFVTPVLDARSAWAWSLGYAWDLGRLRLGHEATRGGLRGLERPGGPGRVDLPGQITAWAAWLRWKLLGEQDGPRGLELALRYANADMDRRFFELGYTRGDQSSQEFRTLAAVLERRFSPGLALGLQVQRTIADDRPATLGGDLRGGRDTSWSLRLRLDY